MPEQQNIEWKTSWRDEYLKWICGFANWEGGSIFIGLSDNGEVLGIDNHKRLMDDLPNKISSKLGVLSNIRLHQENNFHYIEIATKPYNVAISYNGKYYRRSGSTIQELRGGELNDFLLRKSGLTWDEVIEPNATLDDIKVSSIEHFVAIAKKSGRLNSTEADIDPQMVLENLRLMQDGKLKRAALLLFGKDPKKFFISAYLKIGRFGESDADLIHQDVLENDLLNLGDSVFTLLGMKYFKRKVSYENLTRVEDLEYPAYALREALLNAIVHRVYETAPIQISVYDDKIVFWNQGALPDTLTIEDLKTKHASFPRNPLIADVFFKAGYIESWGRGTLQIIAECEKAGLPEPKIEEVNGGISVTIYKDRLSEEFISKLDILHAQKEAIRHVKSNGSITNVEYRELFDVSERTALRHLNELVKLDIFNKIGETKGSRYLIK